MKFNTPSYNGPLVVNIKLKVQYSFSAWLQQCSSYNKKQTALIEVYFLGFTVTLSFNILRNLASNSKSGTFTSKHCEIVKVNIPGY